MTPTRTLSVRVNRKQLEAEDIVSLELPTGAPIYYELKDDLTPAKPRQAIK